MKSKYKIIARDIRWKIESGVYKASEKLPSENGLAIKCNCSRLTARKALQILKDEKLIVTRKGKGYFVSMGTKKRIYESTEGAVGSKIQFHMVDKPISDRSKKIVKSLGFDIENINKDFNFRFMKTQYDSNNRPFTVLHSLINTSIMKDINIESIKESFASYLETKGMKIKKRNEKIIYHRPDEGVAIKLNLKKNEKVLTSYSVVYNENNEILKLAIKYTMPDDFVGNFTTLY